MNYSNLAKILRSIVVPSGTQITGHLVHNGQPCADQLVAIVQLERGVGHHFIKAVQATTDLEGKFAFDHVPASQPYVIFSPVGSGPSPFVLTTKRFTAFDNGKSRNLGSLEVVPALRLAGQLVIPEGLTVPEKAKMSIGRDPAWDLISIDIQSNGRFEISGLPPEVYELRVVAPGLAIDSTKLNYQPTAVNEFGLALKTSIDELRIPVKPAATE